MVVNGEYAVNGAHQDWQRGEVIFRANTKWHPTQSAEIDLVGS
jgi:hypothetical protein